jgi:hypothetical protein
MSTTEAGRRQTSYSFYDLTIYIPPSYSFYDLTIYITPNAVSVVSFFISSSAPDD